MLHVVQHLKAKVFTAVLHTDTAGDKPVIIEGGGRQNGDNGAHFQTLSFLEGIYGVMEFVDGRIKHEKVDQSVASIRSPHTNHAVYMSGF